jgi:hypothetical protein
MEDRETGLLRKPVTPDQGLAQHLLSLTETELAGLLRRRQDVCLPPAPTDALQLAQRLLHRGSLARAVTDLDMDAVLVAQAIDVLSMRATRDGVIELLNADPVLVDNAVRELMGLALAWTHGGRLHVTPVLAEAWYPPLGLGRSISTLLADRSLDRCREFAQSLGINPAELDKSELLGRIGQVLSDPVEVRNRLDQVSPGAAHLLERLRLEAPRVQFDPMSKSVVSELLMRGLIVQIDYRVAELPAEIGMVLSPPAAELTGPPAPVSFPVDPAVLTGAATSAAHSVVAAVTTMLDDAEQTPIAQVKTGGVGVREQRRVAKALQCTEAEVVLWIDLAYAAGLLDVDDDGFVPTDRFDAWRDDDLASRYLTLARAWYELVHSPTDRVTDEGKTVAPPLPLFADIDPIRRGLMRLLSSLAGSAPSAEAVDEAVAWYCPGYPADYLDRTASVIMAEAARLGLVAHGAVTPLGQALLDDDHDLARRLLPEIRQSVNLQSDLTAIVGGEPARAVLSVLRQVADLESGSTWRFTPGSVRRAFDAGMTAEAILASLAGIAERGVPQPLEYLVNDIARRHGQIRALAAGCVVVTDATLATEVLATRSLQPLKLRQVAPTVLVTAESVAKTLDALRAAGFAPVGENKDGTVMLSSTSTHRTVRDVPAPLRPVADPDELAARILATRLSPTEESQLVSQLRAAGPGLSASELIMLADAVETGMPVRIHYQSMSGGITDRVIQDAVLDGGLIVAWCNLRSDERVFSIGRILAVDPA